MSMSNAASRPNGRRDEIARTAAVLFDRLGFHETSMDDLAREVGLKKPTLYHYVTSKAQIVYWIHDDIQNELHGRLKTRLDAGVEPAANLLEVMFDILDIMETYPGHLRVFFENHRNLPDDIRSQALRQRDEYFAAVESIIIDGIARGDFQETSSTKLTTLGLFGMCNWSYQWYRPSGELRAREVATHLWQLFMKGIASPNLRDLTEISGQTRGVSG